MKIVKLIFTVVVLFVTLTSYAGTETVNGIKWTYTVSNGEASLGGGSSSSPAIPTSTSGVIKIPSALGGKPVTRIGNYAFYECEHLVLVTIPDSVRSIGAQAFSQCYNLRGVTIPDGVISIGEWAFESCISLSNVAIPGGVTSIEDGAFENCSGLTSVTIPNGVTSIGNSAFYYCRRMTSVTIPDSVTSIGNGAFRSCISLTRVTIPDSVTNIGASAFNYCTNLTSMTISANVASIGKEAFRSCISLIGVTIPDSVTSIGDYAFSGCSGLTSVTIPNGVTSIGSYAFSDCSSLANIVFYGDAPAIGLRAFYPVASGCCAYVRRASSGWDVDIPGTWTPDTRNNIRIDYLEKIVLFDANGGEGGISNLLDIGTVIVAPTVSRTGYTFVGWSPCVAATVPTCDVTYLAQWEINRYMVRFNANGGMCVIVGRQLNYGASIGVLPVPTREDATFLGWFTAAEDGEKVDASLVVTDEMTLYAHWLILEEALDVGEGITFTNSEGAHWRPILDSHAKVGDDTARSGAIGDRTNTWLSATVSGAGTMSFWCKVSCEHDDDNTFTWDRLMVYTNDVEVVEWRMDGETDWTRREVSFAGGENTVKWVYFKDRSISEGEDCAWVDGVTWTLADVAVDVGGGKSVLVPMDWIDAHSNIVMAVGGDKSAAMKSTAANGRKVWECYVLGLDPEKTADFKITSFPMKADGTPDLSAIMFEPEQSRWNLSGATPKLKGKATLDAEWQDVPPGGNPSFRFFTVEVQMP